MTGQLGMNPEEVEQISRDLQNQAAEIQSVMNRIDGLIGRSQSNWWGTDAQQFADKWQSEHKPRLLNLQQSVQQLGETAMRNAQHQRAVSGRL